MMSGMAVTQTPRFGMTRWGDDLDPQQREDFVDIVDAIEALGVIGAQGTRVARPAPGVGRRLYTVTGDTADLNGLTYYDNGIAWSTVGSALRLARAVAEVPADVPLAAKGAVAQTGDLQQWLNSAGSVLAAVAASGVLMGAAGVHAGPGAKFSTAALDVTPPAAADPAAVIRGAASQTGDLTRWENSSATVLVRIGADGGFAAAGRAAVGTTVGTDVALLVAAALSTDVGVRVRGATAQSGDLAQLTSSVGVVLAAVGPTGQLRSPSTTGSGTRTTRPRFAAALLSAGLLNNANATDISWRPADATQTVDTDNMAPLAAAPGDIIVRTAGRYRVTCYAQWDLNATGFRGLAVRRNGALVTRVGQPGVAGAGGANYAGQQVFAVPDCAVGDTISIQAIQNSGGGLFLLGGTSVDVAWEPS